MTQVGRRLGITRQRAHVLATRADFPAPAQTLPTGRLWRERDVERWLERNPRYDHSDGVERCPACGRPVEVTA